jgi:hypothetical protein
MKLQVRFFPEHSSISPCEQVKIRQSFPPKHIICLTLPRVSQGQVVRSRIPKF